MNEIINQKIRSYTKYLRNKLLNSGCDAEFVNSLSDNAILEDFRKCPDCGGSLVTKDQQMHAILEFDAPERIFEVTYEHLDLESCEDVEVLNIAELLNSKKTFPEVVKELVEITNNLVSLHKSGKRLKSSINGIIKYE